MHPIPVKINSKSASGTDETPWMPAKNGKWNKKANPNIAGIDWNVTGKSCPTQMPINPSNPPPICTLDPIPILDSSNNPAKIAFYLVGNYFSEVDFEYISGTPQMIGFMAPSTSGAFINTAEKSNVCMFPSGLRHYMGTPNSYCYPWCTKIITIFSFSFILQIADKKIYMAVYQFISDEFVLPTCYLPRSVHNIGEIFSLQVNDDFFDIHDSEKQFIGEAASKVLNFIKIKKGYCNLSFSGT